MSRREYIIQLVQRLSTFREEVKRLEDELAVLVPNDVLPRQATAPGTLSLGARALALLCANSGSQFSAKRVTEQLGSHNIQSMRTVLRRLCISGRIQRVECGRYTVAETRVPNATTRAAMKELEAGEPPEVASVGELMADLRAPGSGETMGAVMGMSET